MDRISLLPDDLLVRILSFVPTSDAIGTCVLSKRWRCLWKTVPRLEFDDNLYTSDYEENAKFVYRYLLLNRAHVLDSICLNIEISTPTDVGIWIETAVHRGIRELDIDLYVFNDGEDTEEELVTLPSSLYNCETLETLKLHCSILVDVPSPACFRSLRTLHLRAVSFKSDDSLQKLLSSCPVLEVLSIANTKPNIETLSIEVPSLQRLILRKVPFRGPFMINAPSLKRLNIELCRNGVRCTANNMPELVEAKVEFLDRLTKKVLKTLTSAKRLSLHIPRLEEAYAGIGIFYRLVHLEIHSCSIDWWFMLECSPKLRVLKLTDLNWLGGIDQLKFLNVCDPILKPSSGNLTRGRNERKKPRNTS